MKHNFMAAEKQNLVSLPRLANDAGITIGTMCALFNVWSRLETDQTNFQLVLSLLDSFNLQLLKLSGNLTTMIVYKSCRRATT